VPHKEDGTVYVPIPKNYSKFSDNMLFISIIKVISLYGYETVVADIEVDVNVLKTEKHHFFAGFVAKSFDKLAGPRIKASNAYERGILAAQTDAVCKRLGNRNGQIRKTDHSCGKILSEMGGFVRDYWGLRASINSIFASLPKPKVSDDDIPTYMLQGGELIGKIVRKNLPHSNGGIFLKTELSYLNKRYQAAQLHLEYIHEKCKRPDVEFALAFWEKVDELAKEAKDIQSELGSLFANRAKYLFRSNTKRKTDQRWNKMSIEEKLADSSVQTLEQLFNPLDLPGFKKLKISRTVVDEYDPEEYLTALYRLDKEEDNYSMKLGIVSNYESIREELLKEEH
jgi:hypothetical protein